MKKFILVVSMLVMVSALFVGCETDVTNPSYYDSNSGQTTPTPSQDSSETYESEFVDESDDVTIGEMV